VGAGRYPVQNMSDVPGKEQLSSSAVTFRAQGAVDIAGLNLGDEFTHPNAPDNLAFVGIHGSSAWSIDPGANNISFDHVQTTNIYDNGTHRYVVTNSNFGSCTVSVLNGPCDNFKLDGSPSDVLIANNTFHDFRVAPGSGAHFECMFVAGGTNVVVRGNSFRSCEYFDIFIQYSGNAFNQLQFLQNRFEPPYNGQDQLRDTAVWFSGRGFTWTNVDVNRNSFDNSTLYIDDTPAVSNFHVERNVLGDAECFSGVVYSTNVWAAGKPCGAEDVRRLPFGYSLKDGRLVLSTQHAAALRQLFRACAGGGTSGTVARELRANRATRTVGHWTAGLVTTIASDDTYLGSAFGAKGTTQAVTWPAQFHKAAKRCAG
jgi:hypothetical protein